MIPRHINELTIEIVKYIEYIVAARTFKKESTKELDAIYSKNINATLKKTRLKYISIRRKAM